MNNDDGGFSNKSTSISSDYENQIELNQSIDWKYLKIVRYLKFYLELININNKMISPAESAKEPSS